MNRIHFTCYLLDIVIRQEVTTTRIREFAEKNGHIVSDEAIRRYAKGKGGYDNGIPEYLIPYVEQALGITGISSMKHIFIE